MADKCIKTEESHEVRRKRRTKILQEVFDDCTLETVDKVDDDDRVVGEIVRVRKSVWGRMTTICYTEYCVTRGARFDEMHVPFAQMEPLALDALAKFSEAGVLKIAYDMPELTVIVHYEHDIVKPDEEYVALRQSSGRAQAVRRQLEKLEKEIGKQESVREKEE